MPALTVNVSVQTMFKRCDGSSLLCFFGQAIPCPNRRRKKGVKIQICVSVECMKVVCISKVVVSGFLNQLRDNISQICGCKTMDDFVIDD